MEKEDVKGGKHAEELEVAENEPTKEGFASKFQLGIQQ